MKKTRYNCGGREGPLIRDRVLITLINMGRVMRRSRSEVRMVVGLSHQLREVMSAVPVEDRASMLRQQCDSSSCDSLAFGNRSKVYRTSTVPLRYVGHCLQHHRDNFARQVRCCHWSSCESIRYGSPRWKSSERVSPTARIRGSELGRHREIVPELFQNS